MDVREGRRYGGRVGCKGEGEGGRQGREGLQVRVTGTLYLTIMAWVELSTML